MANSPYEVGATGFDFRTQAAHCSCCGLLYQRRVHRTRPEYSDRCCVPCGEHELPSDSETTGQRMRRLAEHEPRVLEWLEWSRGEIDRLRGVERRAESDRRDSKREVARALSERDRWRDMANAADDLHRPDAQGRCPSCSRKSPCPTQQALDEVDRRRRTL